MCCHYTTVVPTTCICAQHASHYTTVDPTTCICAQHASHCTTVAPTTCMHAQQSILVMPISCIPYVRSLKALSTNSAVRVSPPEKASSSPETLPVSVDNKFTVNVYFSQKLILKLFLQLKA